MYVLKKNRHDEHKKQWNIIVEKWKIQEKRSQEIKSIE